MTNDKSRRLYFVPTRFVGWGDCTDDDKTTTTNMKSCHVFQAIHASFHTFGVLNRLYMPTTPGAVGPGIGRIRGRILCTVWCETYRAAIRRGESGLSTRICGSRAACRTGASEKPRLLGPAADRLHTWPHGLFFSM